MGNKATCPACDSHTSAIFQAFGVGDPCPYCSLPADAAMEVERAARRGADADLQQRCLDAERRAAKAEAEAARLGAKLERIRWAFEDDPDT